MRQLIEEFLELFAEVLGNLYRYIFDELIGKKDHSLSAGFISENEVLDKNYKGFCLTGTKNLSKTSSYQNAIISGGTGTGKSTISLIPSILKMDSSLIVLDPSGELFDKTASALNSKGFEIKVLNFTNSNSSVGYNPLHRANTTSEINAVADSLVRASLGTQGGDPFWRIQSREVLSMLICILKTQDIKYQNLYNVRQLLFTLKSDPNKVDKLFVRFANTMLLNQYKAFISYDSKLSTSILASVQSALQLLTDDEIAKVTSNDTLDIGQFRKKKTALFIQTSINQIHYLSPLTSIIFEQCFQSVMQSIPKENELDIFFLLDEASTIKIPGSTMAATISNIRKYRAGMLLVYQSAVTQLTENYGKDAAKTIMNNCLTKLYFSGQGLETTSELSELLGRYEYTDEKEIRRTRQLMTSDEIRTMKPTEGILINSFKRPIKVKLTPYYMQRKLLALTELPALPESISHSENTLDLLDLNNLPQPCKNQLN
jgi:type IV secretion system protein VirD4